MGATTLPGLFCSTVRLGRRGRETRLNLTQNEMFVKAALIGIDPGVSGAVACIVLPNTYIVWDTPTLTVTVGKKHRNVMNLIECAAILEGFKAFGPAMAAIEWAQPMPKQGVTSVFNYGEGFGSWLGILSALAIPFIRVRPQQWKKEILAGREIVGKDTSRLAAMEMFPNVDFGKRKDAGRAEALLIAEFCRRQRFGHSKVESNE